jgi:predicted transcriptional regulator
MANANDWLEVVDILTMQDRDLLEHTVKIIASWTAANESSADDLVKAIGSVHLALKSLAAGQDDAVTAQAPAVPVKKSVTPDYIICLEDGKQLKMLKRHLQTAYGMTPDEYRRKWGLPADYPMVAPNYAETRSRLAKHIGLGQRGKGAAKTPAGATPQAAAKPAARKRNRKKAAA